MRQPRLRDKAEFKEHLQDSPFEHLASLKISQIGRQQPDWVDPTRTPLAVYPLTHAAEQKVGGLPRTGRASRFLHSAQVRRLFVTNFITRRK
jgi:hypothetical protein